MKKHIIQLTDNDLHLIPIYREFATTLIKIKKFLHTQFQKDFHLYTSVQGDFYDVMDMDLEENNQVEWLATVTEGFPSHVIDKENQEMELKPNLYNSLFYYASFEVAIFCSSFMDSAKGQISRDFILCSSEENFQKYLHYVEKRKRERDKNSISMFIDGPHGMIRRTEKIKNPVSREDIFMEEKLKNQIFQSVDSFFQTDKNFYEKYNLPYKRGILLYGRPGTGKTTLVKSIVHSVDAPVVYWQITEYTTSRSIDEVFYAASRISPMVLVIEDIDSLPEKVRSIFLNTLDGATSKEGIFLIGTTNYPERVDEALKNRTGRFDQAYEIGIPAEEFRRKYLLNNKIDDFLSEEEIETVIELTKGFTMAQLNGVFLSILSKSHYEGKVDVTEVVQYFKSLNQKQAKAQWFEEETKGKMGFN